MKIFMSKAQVSFALLTKIANVINSFLCKRLHSMGNLKSCNPNKSIRLHNGDFSTICTGTLYIGQSVAVVEEGVIE